MINNWAGRRKFFSAVSCGALLVAANAALAQGPPGCYAPRNTVAEITAGEKRVAEAEKRNHASAELAQALEELADMHRDFQPDKALAELRRALSIREALAGKENSQSPAVTLVDIAYVYEMQGKYGEAMKQLDRAEQLTKQDVRRTADATMFNVLYHQANCYLGAQPNDPVRAEQKAKALLALAEKHYGVVSAHVYQAIPMLRQAYVLGHKNQEVKALDAREQALLVKLGNPLVGQGTARHLDLEPILKREDQGE